MTRLLLLLALSGVTACSGVCETACREKYDDCLDTGRTEEECAAMLANCVESCSAVESY